MQDENSQDKAQLVKSTNLSSIRVLKSSSIQPVDFDKNKPAHRDGSFFASIGQMILSTRKTGDWNSDGEPAMIQEAMRRADATIGEVADAFWRAYSDPYTPSTGIEWRHINKHIQAFRTERDERYYNPPKSYNAE